MDERRQEDRRKEHRRSDDVAQETQNALHEREIQLLHTELDALKLKVDVLTKDRERALLWGISMLGAAVIGMAGWIFSLFGSNLPKGH